MKGNEAVIAQLNDLLADELTAINQYMVHSEMCANWGYEKLHEAIEKRAIVEMRHAEKLIGRIIFLDGPPVVSKLKTCTIGANVEMQHNNDKAAEDDAVNSTTMEFDSPGSPTTTGPATSSRTSLKTRRTTSTGWRLSSTRSSR